MKTLRGILQERGGENIAMGMNQETSYRPYAWGKRGRKIQEERLGKRGIRTNLIAAHRKNTLLAPMLFTGSTDTTVVNLWVKKALLKEIRPTSTVIFDNAITKKTEKRFFRKKAMISSFFLLILLIFILSNRTLLSLRKDDFIPPFLSIKS